jgi:hypothetical protein
VIEGPEAIGDRRNLVGRIWLGRFGPVIEQKIELGGVEPGDLHIELQFQGSQILQLDLEDLLVPASQLGQPIVGDHIGPALGIRQMVQPNGRHPRDAMRLERGSTQGRRRTCRAIDGEAALHRDGMRDSPVQLRNAVERICSDDTRMLLANRVDQVA